MVCREIAVKDDLDTPGDELISNSVNVAIKIKHHKHICLKTNTFNTVYDRYTN